MWYPPLLRINHCFLLHPPPYVRGLILGLENHHHPLRRAFPHRSTRKKKILKRCYFPLKWIFLRLRTVQMNISSDDDVLDNQSLPVELPENPLPVPRIGAPTQNSYFVSGDGLRISNRCCSAASFGYPHLARDCSRQGWKIGLLVKRHSALMWVCNKPLSMSSTKREPGKDQQSDERWLKNKTFLWLLSQRTPP